MKNSRLCDLEDMISVFDTSVSAADIIAAKALAGISAEIVKYRVNLGMTQKQFAEYMEVSQGMVSKWESADYNFSVKSLAYIAAKLDMDVVVCFKDVKKDKKKEAVKAKKDKFDKLVEELEMEEEFVKKEVNNNKALNKCFFCCIK